MAAAAVERPGAPPPPKQRYQGVQKESSGYRLMTAMGWKEGEGLGASKQGIKSHIKVKKKFENWGVGAVEAAQHAQNWTNGMLDFHRVLSNLSEVVSEHAKKRSASSSDSGSSDSDASDSSDSDSEQPKQKQAAAPRGSKKRKTSSSSGSSSEEEEEEAAAEPAAPQRVRAATHLGRFKKREAGKMTKAYSEHDMAAILGADPFAAMAATLAPVTRAASSSGYDSDSEPSEDEEEAAPGSKAAQQKVKSKGKAAGVKAAADAAQQQQQKPAPEMIVVRRPMQGSLRPAAPPTPPEGRQPGWWQLCFHRAAGPGVGAAAQQGQQGQQGQGAAITIHGFSEQDQTNLYNLAHDKATKGRVGLGVSSMPKKVAGARWEGKRTRIEDSDADEDEEADGEGSFERQQGPEVGPAPAGVELEKEEGLVIIVPAAKRHLLDTLPDAWQQQQQAGAVPAAAQQQQQAAAEPAGKAGSGKKAAKKARKAAAEAAEAEASPRKQQQQAAAAADSPADALKPIKWRKAVGAVLKASGKAKLRLSKLHRALVKEQDVPKAQRPAALEALTAFLQSGGGGKFCLEDDVVRPSA